MPITLTEFDAALGPTELGELWALGKDGKRLRLIVQTQPKGWLLCLCQDGEALRRDHIRRRARVILIASRWRTNAEQAGWDVLRVEEIDAKPGDDLPRRRRRTPPSS
jgi:hypothetical protein